jgi:hypothetical protein
MAERVGFEPTCRNYPTIRFRVGAVMTTSVPLRSNQKIYVILIPVNLSLEPLT